jgi:hypothetical protein
MKAQLATSVNPAARNIASAASISGIGVGPLGEGRCVQRRTTRLRRPLPGLIAVEGALTAEDRQAAAWLQPFERAIDDPRLVKPVEGFARGDQVEGGRRRRQRLGRADKPAHVGDAAPLGCRLPGRDHLWLQVDRPYLDESVRQLERQPSRSAAEVEQPAAAADPGPPEQILQHRPRVRQPVAGVVAGRAGKGV